MALPSSSRTMKNQMGWLFLLVMAGVVWNQAEGSES